MGNFCNCKREDIQHTDIENAAEDKENVSIVMPIAKQEDHHHDNKKKNTGDPNQRKFAAKKQRRRLTVAPNHVGDISRIEQISVSRASIWN